MPKLAVAAQIKVLLSCQLRFSSFLSATRAHCLSTCDDHADVALGRMLHGIVLRRQFDSQAAHSERLLIGQAEHLHHVTPSVPAAACRPVGCIGAAYNVPGHHLRMKHHDLSLAGNLAGASSIKGATPQQMQATASCATAVAVISSQQTSWTR